MTLGVGIIGAGPVTQAIHLPTIARLNGEFKVTHVMDIDAAVAERVANRVDASWSTTVDAVMADQNVDVIAICSPPQFHAEQVIAAIDAGKRGILCEKPFATSFAEAEALGARLADAGVPLLVAAMHTFDPGWLAAEAWCEDLREEAHTIVSSIVLPMNQRYEDWATQIVSRPPMPAPADLSDPEVRSAYYRAGIMGLAIHDLPLVRLFAPKLDAVHSIDVLAPFGYAVTAEAEGRTVRLFGHMNDGWQPDWTLDVWSAEAHLHASFTPSYVHAGSAVVTITRNGETRTFGPYADNGYVEEWRQLAALIRGGAQDPAQLQRFIDDVTYALEFAGAIESKGAVA